MRTAPNGVDPADVSLTNTDNDAAGIVVDPTSGLTTTEAGGTATFTVVLTSQPTADVTVGLSSSDARLWDDGRGCTFSMRSKEEAHDYRYFPEPDLPPLRIDPGRVEEWRRSLPELPHERTTRFVAEHGLSIEDALLITSTRRQADYFEECARLSGNPRAVANWMMGDLAYALRNAGLNMEDCPLPAPRLAALIRQVDSGTISGKMAKTVFEEVFRSGDETEVVIKRLGLVLIVGANHHV